MKVTDHDYQTLRLAVQGSMREVETGRGRAYYDRAGHTDERRRWDAFWHGTQGREELRNRLLTDYADAHLDTALHKLQKEVTA